ncbi:M20/M25/M40 family metallo-hydrolase [Nostocoides sp. F2B08]|uniref:M20 family metallopeptidase n=1 Tax=Nostocoides sp. F2B08 TaxID=2653936 RepID=UPI0012631F7D|nr:M20/M25/M40 family metallo-hydrolase [Tetrasphaera sp. F2B08]KAB7742442.1 M20/M25/M40 family metallo-hydrolase [Tetrasphaera sp. F2B08]
MTIVPSSDAGEDATRLAAALVSLDTTNPGLVTGAPGERAAVEHLRSRLDRAGFTTHVLTPHEDADRPSLVAYPPDSERLPTVILNGHLDTVGPGAMVEPFSARVVGDRMFGRGAADMKAGVAALVVAAERAAEFGVVRPVLALVADEEDAGLGSETVIAALPALGIRPDVCLIAEPTDLALARSVRGFAVVLVRIGGRAAHSSQPDLGTNAVSRLGRLIAAVDEHAPRVRAAGGDLMVTVARGGESPFVIPAAAECVVERRVAPGETLVEVVTEIRTLLEPDWDTTIEVLAQREPWRCDTAGPARRWGEALGERLGTGWGLDAPYWLEAPLWQRVCPTVVSGPSGGGLHSDDEWVDLAQLRAFTRVLVDTLGMPELWGARAD